MLINFPKGRKAATFVSIGVAVFYIMVLIQALSWQDGDRFLTQLIVAPFGIVFLGGLAFLVGASFDVFGHRTQRSGPGPTVRPMNDPVITKPAAEPDRVDPYSQAGQEVLTGDVLPDLWARSLAKADLGELAVKAEYVRLRVEQLSAVDERIIAGSAALELTDEPPNKVESDISGEDPESTFNFTAAELAVYGFHQVDVLEEALRNGDPDTLYAIRNTIGRKIGRIAGTDDERVFLEAFCEQLRAHLSDPT